MNYEEALTKIQIFNRFGSKLGLERMAILLEYLDNPQKNMKIIHVAGTNGKGSVCRFIYSVLRAEGYKVGLYTSPFLEDFTERIEFDGTRISEKELAESTEIVLNKAELMVKNGWESPTEFEIVTAIAFYYYSQKPMDYLILEVGLGGRGDATNIIQSPLVSVITSISYDHMEYLGNTLEAIAREKAGIIKAGRPVVVSVDSEASRQVIWDIGKERGARVDFVNKGDIQEIVPGENAYDFKVKRNLDTWDKFSITLRGSHQVQNALTAIRTIEVLKEQGVKITRESIDKGLKTARHPGRFETLLTQPLTIIDGAHNQAGMESLKKTIQEIFPDKKIMLCIGILKDKEIDEMLDIICPVAQEIIATEPNNMRKMSSDEICTKVLNRGIPCRNIPSREEAFAYLLENAKDQDIIIYAGSLYLIGDIRRLYKQVNKAIE